MSNAAETLEQSIAGEAPASAAPAELPEPKKAAKPTSFAFEHAVFSVTDAYFSLSPVLGDPVYNVPLGDVRATLPIDTVAGSFQIKQTSPDADLLQVVKRSLKFVKEIRPGDSIPSELLDGTASWKVEPHHREIAHARITVQLVSWMSGKPLESVDAAELESIASLPETKKKVQEAFEVMAEKLGLGRERKQEVVAKIEELARELSYIEALRERAGKIQKLYANFSILTGVYNCERSILEDVSRVRILMKKPVSDIASIFEQIDANTGEILITLKKFPVQIKYIREMRDELHHRFMRWDGLIEQWSGAVLERSAHLDRLTRVTYQFAARHFPLNTEWGLQR
jgi:hypothetical protein